MEIKNILKGFLTVVLSIVILNFSAADDVKVYVEDHLINSSSTWVNVSIHFNTSKGFASLDFWIYYNESILNISKISTENGFAGACNRQRVGKWKCSLYQSSGINIQGNISVVSVNFSVLGRCGVKSNIGVSIDYIQNSSYHVLTYSITNGSVIIKCDNCNCPSGKICNTTTHLCQSNTTTTALRPTIVVGNYITNPGGNVSVIVNVTDAPKIQAYSFNITYDPTVVTPTSVVNAGFADVTSNLNYSYGKVYVTADSVAGKTGNFSLFIINFSANSNAVGRMSPIAIEVENFGNSSGDTPCIVQNGSITIKCNSTNCPSGTICNTTTLLCQSNTTTLITPTITCYRDADNDGYGNAANNITTANTICPNGYVDNSDDCNDNNASIHPNATDIPNNGIDENCNGYDNITCYADLDNDNYTNNTNIVYSDNGCPANYKNSSTEQDYNDNDSTINLCVNENKTECKFGYYLREVLSYNFDDKISDIQIYDIDKDGIYEIITTTAEYNWQSCGNFTIKIFKNNHGNLVEIWNKTIDGDVVFKFADIDNDNKSEIIIKSTCQNYYNRNNNKYKIYVYDDSILNFTKIAEIDVKIYAPDLLFLGINFSKANISNNDNITIALKILNNGSTDAVNVMVELNIINNLRNFFAVKYINVSAYSEATAEFNWTATFGKNEIFGEIDKLNTIYEINESNNKIYTNLTVIDLSPPHIKIVSPPNNSIINKNFLKFSITDDISVDKVRYAINNDSNDSFNGSFNDLPYPYYISTKNLTSGKYNIIIIANDTSGNIANATFSFIVDSTLPTVKFSMPEHIYINDSTDIEVFADVYDDSAIKEVYAEIYFYNTVSQISLNYDTKSNKWKGDFEGKAGYYTIKIVAIDTLGNINNSEIAEFDVSKILNAGIENSTIIASIIENSKIKNSNIIASVIKDSVLNYTLSNLSEIEKVSSENSRFEGSILYKCNAINSTIINTDVKSSRMLGSKALFYPTFVNATIVDGVLINGSIFDTRINAIGEKIGAKPGAKIGAKVGARIGGRISAKPAAKIGARIGAKISAKIGVRIGAKIGPGIIIGDIDKDGKKEIIVVMNQIYIFENNGNNNFVKVWNSNTIENSISKILINDSDNDGNLEIIASTYNKIYIFENIGDNAYSEVSTYSGNGISNLIVDDLNNDGKNEILFKDSSGIHILKNNGSKILEISNYSIYVDNLWIDDLNNDGNKEIIYYKREWINDRCVYSYYYDYYSCGHYKTTIGILENDGNNHYSKISDETIPEYVWINNMFFDDLNNDGIKEILIVSDKIYILENNGNFYVKTYNSENEIKYIQKILFKDIDNDSKKELIVLSYENYWGGKNEISIYKINECGGIFVSETTERQQYSKGEEFNYTITVKAINFTNITIKDNLSECLEFIGSNLASNVQNGAYVWKLNGGIHRLNLKVKAKEDCEGNVANNVFVEGEKEGFNFSSSAQASVYIEPPKIISQQYPYWQWHRPENNNGLSSITITIKVQGKLRNLSVIDTLPKGSRFLNASLNPKISDNKLIWNLGDMENEVKTINLTMDFPNVSNAWAYNYVYVKGQYSNGTETVKHSSSAIIRIGDYIDPVWVFVEPTNITKLPNDTIKFNITTILEANTTTRNVETLFTLPPELKLITATGNFTIIKTDKTTLKWHVEGPFKSGVNTTFNYEIIAKISPNTLPKILTANADAYSDVVDKIEEYHTNSTIIIPFCNGNCSGYEFCNKTINKCMPKKNNNNTCNVSEECISNNCFNGICRAVGWECDNDSDCSANHFCNNEHKCQIKSNGHKSSNTHRNEGGIQIITLTQTQQVTANNTASKTNETNKSKEKPVDFNKSNEVNVSKASKEENNAEKDKGKILEEANQKEANYTEASQKEISKKEEANQNNSDNKKLPLVIIVAIITSIVTMLLLLKMNKRKK